MLPPGLVNNPLRRCARRCSLGTNGRRTRTQEKSLELFRKASMETIGGGGGSKAQSTERPTVIPEGARKSFQKERPRGQTTQNESAASSEPAHRSEQGPRGRGAAASAPANSSRPDLSRPHRDREIYFPLAFEEWLVAENIRNFNTMTSREKDVITELWVSSSRYRPGVQIGSKSTRVERFSSYSHTSLRRVLIT